MSNTEEIIVNLRNGRYQVHRKYFIEPKNYNEATIINTIKNIHEDLNKDIDGNKFPLVYGSNFEGLFITFGVLGNNEELTHDAGLELESFNDGTYANLEYDGGLSKDQYNKDNVKVMMKNLLHELKRLAIEDKYPITKDMNDDDCDSPWPKNKTVIIDIYYGRFFRH